MPAAFVICTRGVRQRCGDAVLVKGRNFILLSVIFRYSLVRSQTRYLISGCGSCPVVGCLDFSSQGVRPMTTDCNFGDVLLTSTRFVFFSCAVLCGKSFPGWCLFASVTGVLCCALFQLACLPTSIFLLPTSEVSRGTGGARFKLGSVLSDVLLWAFAA